MMAKNNEENQQEPEKQEADKEQTPQDRVSQSYVLKWGSIIGGLIVVIGIMLILSTTQGNVLTGGAGATIPGILARDTVVVEQDQYHQTIEDLRQLRADHPELESEIDPILKELRNSIQ